MLIKLRKLNNFGLVNNNIFNMISISLGKFLYGFYTAAIGLLIIPMTETFNITLRTQSIIFPFNYIGQMVGMTALLFTYINSYYLFLILFLFMGLFSSNINMIVDASVSDIFDKKKGFYLNISHIFFGFGALLSPIVFNLIFFATGDFKKFYFILFILSFLILFIIILAKYPDTKIKKIKFNIIGKLLKNSKFSLLCIYIIIGSGTMHAISGWLPTLLYKNLNLTQEISNYLLSLFWLAVIAGRIITAILSKRYKEVAILSAMNIIIFVMLIITFFMNNPLFLMVTYFLIGVGMGGFFPLIVSQSANIHPKYSATRVSIIFSSSVVGMLIIPTLIGLFADYFMIYKAISFTSVFFLFYSYIFYKKF